MESLNRVKRITGKGDEHIEFIKVDLLDKEALAAVFEGRTFASCIHFAALKAVGESVANPLKYYVNNLSGTFNLLEAMQNAGVKRIGTRLPPARRRPPGWERSLSPAAPPAMSRVGCLPG